MKNALWKIASPEDLPANDPFETESKAPDLAAAIEASWGIIAPFWPLKNLVAVNPLQGFEDLPFEDAWVEAGVWFRRGALPSPMEAVNRESIKWCQAFFDDGQATIAMPVRKRGLYGAWRALARFDSRLHGGDRQRKTFLQALPERAEASIERSLEALGIDPAHRTQFMALMLSTLPGWAAHIRYRTHWASAEPAHPFPVSPADYLAVRLAITGVLWPDARRLLDWHAEGRAEAREQPGVAHSLAPAEEAYRQPLLRQLARQPLASDRSAKPPRAQCVFCIDVRSEPIRRALEACGDYETFGFAGFFGLPLRVENAVTGESHAACPVLLEPKHVLRESPQCAPGCDDAARAGQHRMDTARRFYQSLKYTFAAPFALVEATGPVYGAWMALRSLAPVWADRLRERIQNLVRPAGQVVSDVGGIPMADRCAYAESALRGMGLTRNFARLVVLVGHGSTTRNNPFATSLDCGACGGRHGGANARALAAILNDPWVREHLGGRGILIPGTTQFVAAEHDTATDEITLFCGETDDPRLNERLRRLRDDLDAVRRRNTRRRSLDLGFEGSDREGTKHALRRSRDWAQVRPEWGLARNAAFIAASRELTRDLDLEGRAFLHSYDWRQDPDGSILTQILTAPMVVAQWINAQYLFSTVDNVAFGGGSKITNNITGKLGVMQGNASDLMHGLPLQSVFARDGEAWHQPLRLLTVVAAPRDRVRRIVQGNEELRRLIGNGWVTLACVDPEDGRAWRLERNLARWQPAA